MTAQPSAASSPTLQKLIALAQEPACGRRRILLHELTDPLFAAPPEHKGRLEALLPLVAEELAQAEYSRRARLRRRIGKDLLIRLLRDGEHARAIGCFAELTEIGYEAAHGVFADPTNGLLAMICKVQRWPRADFITIALLKSSPAKRAEGDHPKDGGGGDRPAGADESGSEPTLEQAAALADLYDRIPLAPAERAIRFWRLRRRATADIVASEYESLRYAE